MEFFSIELPINLIADNFKKLQDAGKGLPLKPPAEPTGPVILPGKGLTPEQFKKLFPNG